MMKAGPSFIHDLRHGLWYEVEGLFSHHRQHVALPALERGVLDQEAEDVALGLFRKALLLLDLRLDRAPLLLEELGRVDEAVHVFLGAELPRDARLLLLGGDLLDLGAVSLDVL